MGRWGKTLPPLILSRREQSRIPKCRSAARPRNSKVRLRGTSPEPKVAPRQCRTKAPRHIPGTQSVAPRHVPGTLERERKGVRGPRETPREARFHPVLRQSRAAARRFVVLDPGQGSAALHLSGNVRRGRTSAGAPSRCYFPPAPHVIPAAAQRRAGILAPISIGSTSPHPEEQTRLGLRLEGRGSLASMVHPAGIPRPSRRHAKPHGS